MKTVPWETLLQIHAVVNCHVHVHVTLYVLYCLYRMFPLYICSIDVMFSVYA